MILIVKHLNPFWVYPVQPGTLVPTQVTVKTRYFFSVLVSPANSTIQPFLSIIQPFNHFCQLFNHSTIFFNHSTIQPFNHSTIFEFWGKTSLNGSPCSESCPNMFIFHQKCLEKFAKCAYENPRLSTLCVFFFFLSLQHYTDHSQPWLWLSV